MSQIFTTIATFDHYLKAHFYKNNLENAGISCFLADEYMVSADPMLANALGGIKLKVLSFDVHASLQLMKKWEDLPYYTSEGKVLACPKCNSSYLTRDFKVVRGVKDFLAFIWAMLTFTYPLRYKNKSFCKDCEHIF